MHSLRELGAVTRSIQFNPECSNGMFVAIVKCFLCKARFWHSCMMNGYEKLRCLVLDVSSGVTSLVMSPMNFELLQIVVLYRTWQNLLVVICMDLRICHLQDLSRRQNILYVMAARSQNFIYLGIVVTRKQNNRRYSLRQFPFCQYLTVDRSF